MIERIFEKEFESAEVNEDEEIMENFSKFSSFYRWSIMCRLLPLWRLSIYLFRSKDE